MKLGTPHLKKTVRVYPITCYHMCGFIKGFPKLQSLSAHLFGLSTLIVRIFLVIFGTQSVGTRWKTCCSYMPSYLERTWSCTEHVLHTLEPIPGSCWTFPLRRRGTFDGNKYALVFRITIILLMVYWCVRSIGHYCTSAYGGIIA